MAASIDPVEFLAKLISHTKDTQISFSAADLYPFAQNNLHISSADCDLLIGELLEKKYLVLKERYNKPAWKLSLKGIKALHDLRREIDIATLASLCELRGDLLSLETAVDYYRELGANATGSGEGLAALHSIERVENNIAIKKKT